MAELDQEPQFPNVNTALSTIGLDDLNTTLQLAALNSLAATFLKSYFPHVILGLIWFPDLLNQVKLLSFLLFWTLSL